MRSCRVEPDSRLAVEVIAFRGFSMRPASIQAELKVMRLMIPRANSDRVQSCLRAIDNAARDPDAPLMPLFVEAVSAYATLGEICDTLRGVFGEYLPDSWV